MKSIELGKEGSMDFGEGRDLADTFSSDREE